MSKSIQSAAPSRRTIHTASSRTSSDGRADFTAIAIAYAEAAIADRRRTWACKLLRLAARRFLRDLERAQGERPPFVFDWNWAQRACRFIETLPHVEEKWATESILLEPAQVFFVVQLFGFRNRDGSRRFSEALFCVARKNAKSTLAAAIMIACLCLERNEGAQLISAATTGDQAKVIWGIAGRMIQKRPRLKEEFGVEVFSKSIARAESGASFKAINSKASTQDGLNPSHTAVDEIHAHKTPDLMNVLRSAAGARSNPLWLYTTTEGYPNAGPWDDLRNFAKHVLNRVFRADHFLAIIFALDDDDDEFNPATWIKANPLMVCNPHLGKQIAKLAQEAQQMPSVLSEFRIKRCNRPSQTATGFVQLPAFMRCGGTLPEEQLIGKPCYAALDLSSNQDMSSCWYLFLVDGLFALRGRYWVPESAVRARTERNTTPYASWVAAKHVTQTPGDVIDQAIVRRDILEDFAKYSPSKFGFDPWNAAALATDLQGEGLPMEQFIQGARSYHPAIKAFEIAYLSGKIRHGSHPVLRWNAANLVMRYDANMNMAPDKRRSADKIDGICCVIMAFGLAEADDSEAFNAYLANPVTG